MALDITEVVAKAQELVDRIGAIDSFEAVAEWDAAAATAVDQLREVRQQIQAQHDELQAQASQHDEERKSKGFFQKLTATNMSPQLRMKAQQVLKQASQIETVADTLEAWIDRTPDSIEDAKAMISELKLAKKELALQKKEANVAMREIRETSRAKTAGYGRGSGAAFARNMERIRKESKLSGHQNVRNQIEAQINAIDRQILWLERIKS